MFAYLPGPVLVIQPLAQCVHAVTADAVLYNPAAHAVHVDAPVPVRPEKREQWSSAKGRSQQHTATLCGRLEGGMETCFVMARLCFCTQCQYRLCLCDYRLWIPLGKKCMPSQLMLYCTIQLRTPYTWMRLYQYDLRDGSREERKR